MIQNWKNSVQNFISLANKHKVKMLLVGGGAVNFHGYQRHSADVDFWLETSKENFKKLIAVFQEMGYEIDDLPEKVKNKSQNISIKFSPFDLDVELITNFSINKSFEKAYQESEEALINKEKVLRWRVISLDDLITSKIKSGRAKDLLDIQQLRAINNF